ncbi:hypothetical protein Tco_0374079, partial [Tanacetum coccineum]
NLGSAFNRSALAIAGTTIREARDFVGLSRDFLYLKVHVKAKRILPMQHEAETKSIANWLGLIAHLQAASDHRKQEMMMIKQQLLQLQQQKYQLSSMYYKNARNVVGHNKAAPRPILLSEGPNLQQSQQQPQLPHGSGTRAVFLGNPNLKQEFSDTGVFLLSCED